MDGVEYCGKQSTCVNNDDDTRGLTCECSSGYTAHRIFVGEERKVVVVKFDFHLSRTQAAETWMNAQREEQSARQTPIV